MEGIGYILGFMFTILRKFLIHFRVHVNSSMEEIGYILGFMFTILWKGLDTFLGSCPQPYGRDWIHFRVHVHNSMEGIECILGIIFTILIEGLGYIFMAYAHDPHGKGGIRKIPYVCSPREGNR
jgi:hypothetical protein